MSAFAEFVAHIHSMALDGATTQAAPPDSDNVPDLPEENLSVAMSPAPTYDPGQDPLAASSESAAPAIPFLLTHPDNLSDASDDTWSSPPPDQPTAEPAPLPADEQNMLNIGGPEVLKNYQQGKAQKATTAPVLQASTMSAAPAAEPQDDALHLQAEKKRLEDKLNSPSSYPGEEADRARLEEINRKLGQQAKQPPQPPPKAPEPLTAGEMVERDKAAALSKRAYELGFKDGVAGKTEHQTSIQLWPEVVQEPWRLGPLVGDYLHGFNEVPALKTITIIPADFTMKAYTKRYLGAQGEYTDGSKRVLTHLVKWNSSDSGTVSLDMDNGRAVASMVGDGKATITATHPSGGQPGSINVTVKPPELSIVGIDNHEFVLGSSFQLNATATDPNNQDVGVGLDRSASLVPNESVRWISSNSDVVSIDDNGMATMRRVDSATITVQDKRTNASSPPKDIKVIGAAPNAQAVELNILVDNHMGRPMNNYKGTATFRGPSTGNVKDVVLNGDIKDGKFQWRGTLSLAPSGSLHFKAINENTEVHPEGQEGYDLPASGKLTFKVKQGQISGTKKTVKIEEAARLLNAKGTVGIDITGVHLGVEYGAEDQQKVSQGVETEWQIFAGTEAFTIQKF